MYIQRKAEWKKYKIIIITYIYIYIYILTWENKHTYRDRGERQSMNWSFMST